jgi:histidinol-phosphate aminotransferase
MGVKAKTVLDAIGFYMVGISKLEGWDNPAKLSSNESVLGMSPKAIEAATRAVAQSHLYPEVDTEILAEEIAKRYQLDPAKITFGAGSDELLQRIVNTYAGPGDELVHSAHAYMQFPIYAKLAGATPVAAADNNFRYDVDSILAAVTERTRIVLLANPDNPSGSYLTGKEIRHIHSQLADNVLLIMDSAYEEFATEDDYESATRLVDEFENVIVTRTFSKVYGMAGLRLGWCYGTPEMIDLITRIGPSFPANSVAFAAAVEAIKDQDHVDNVLRHNRRWITQLTSSLTDKGLVVYPSHTNFLLVQFPAETGKTAEGACEYLNQNGLIPRQFAVDNFYDKLRFTIGDNDAMQKTISVLGDYMKQP